MCTMLVILAICLLLLVVSSRWCRITLLGGKEEENSSGASEHFQQITPSVILPPPTQGTVEQTTTVNPKRLEEDIDVRHGKEIITNAESTTIAVTTKNLTINKSSTTTEGATRSKNNTEGAIPEKKTGEVFNNQSITETDIPYSTTEEIARNESIVKNQNNTEDSIPKTKIEAVPRNESSIETTTQEIRKNTTEVAKVDEDATKKIPPESLETTPIPDPVTINPLNNKQETTTVKNSTESNHFTTTFATTAGKITTTTSGEKKSEKIIATEPTELKKTTVHDNFQPIMLVGETDLEPSASSEPQNSTKSSIEFNSLIMKEKDTCNSNKCDLTAARIISSMDLSKPPCDNFYDFACGGILGDKTEDVDIFAANLMEGEGTPEFLQKFNIFYRSCVKYEDRFDYQRRIKKAKELVESVGLFQFKDQVNTTYNITEFMANLILFKAMPLFEVDVDVDPDKSAYILKLLPTDQSSVYFDYWFSISQSKKKCLRETDEFAAGPSINLTSLYTYYTRCRKNYSDYLDSIETSVRELGFFSNLTDKKLFAHITDIRVLIEFDILDMLDKMETPPYHQDSIIRKRYENIKLGELEKKFPVIQWINLFKLISNENVDADTIIQVYNRPYFDKAFDGLSKVDTGRLNNAFLAILANSLYESTVLPAHRHSRVKFCKKRSKELMPDVVNYLYKKLIPTKELGEQNGYIQELYIKLKKQFDQSLENLEWLDDESRTSIRKKLNSIELAMFRTDDLLPEQVLMEDGYSDLDLVKNDYQYNLFNLMEFRRKRLFSIQGQNVTPANMYRQFVDATKEEPVFFYTTNIVCIPYGLTKRATKDLPGYIIMAQVGFPLAKIIGHGFDPIGMQYRVKLSESAKMAYTTFADMSRDMVVLSNPITFNGREFFFTLNNALSESERIAENTAMRLLTESFNTFGNQSLLPWISYKFSREKIFFLAVAQELCRKMSLIEFMIEAYESHILPPQFRIENILGNSGEFVTQFSCPAGSAMTRIEEPLQFPYLTDVSREDNDYM